MADALDPSNRGSRMLEVVDDNLVHLADGAIKKLMVFTPPQVGKSQRISRRFPTWLLEHDPTLRIGIVSYSAALAERWGRQIRRDIEQNPTLGIELAGDSRAANYWETTKGGSCVSVGLAGGITGLPVDVLVIDDPVRGRAEAESVTYREAAWDWWESNGSTRLSSRGRVVVMQTRWHEDDLSGRLLVNEPGEWRVVRIPAIAEDGDPLGRQPGEELESVQGREPDYYHRLKATRSPYVFSSIYQQSPTAAEGAMFKRLHWRYWRSAPDTGIGQRLDLGGRIFRLADSWRFGTMDLASSTKTTADWTVVSAWALTLDGDLVLLDRARKRIEESGHFDLVRPMAERYQLDTLFVEEAHFNTTLVREATRNGVQISPLKADTDKVTRALPASDRQRAGRMWLPAGAEWLEEWIGEHASFPSAAHDDQVDTTGYAVRVAVTKPAPPLRIPRSGRNREAEGPDFMNMSL